MKPEKHNLVLLPGLDGTGRLFERFIPLLPADIRVTVVQYPSDSCLSLKEYAARVVEVIPPGPVVLLAESFSGLVALTLLREYSVPVQKLIFVGSFAASPRKLLRLVAPLLPALARAMRRIPSSLIRLFCLGWNAKVADVAWLEGVLASVRPELIAHRLRIVASSRLPAEPLFNVPSTYIQADEDRLVPPSAARLLGQHFHDFSLISVEGPHFLLQARPEKCAALVGEMVRSSIGPRLGDR